MELRFTAHALARMTERGISEEQVRQVLTAPLRTVPADFEREEFQGLLQREGRPSLLRVIVERDLVISVITVIATSKLAKYGVSS